MTDADQHAQLLLKLFLQLTACNQRGRLTPRLQPVQHGREHFGWMPLSAILEGGFSSSANFLLPPIHGGSADLEVSAGCCFLPGVTRLQQLDQMLFDCTSLLSFHPCFSLFSEGRPYHHMNQRAKHQSPEKFKALGIEHPCVRHCCSLANLNTLTSVLINLRALQHACSIARDKI